MLSSASEFLPDANKVSRRTDDNVLPLSKVWVPMERKLIFILLLFLLCVMNMKMNVIDAKPISTLTTKQYMKEQPFKIVLFICIWRRPLLTKFVINYFISVSKHLKLEHNIILDLFIIGSEPNFSIDSIYDKQNVNVIVRILPNKPIGAKHQLGLLSVREHYEKNSNKEKIPNAITIFGSDDVISGKYFLHVRQLFLHENIHVFGIRDIWFYDLKAARLIYTSGYTSYATPLASTVGCGRAFSWEFLNAIDWQLWDKQLNRSLDQSAIRNVMVRFPFASEISDSVKGKSLDIITMDIKTDGFENGVGQNVWKFDTILRSADGTGRLNKYEEEMNITSRLLQGFDEDFVTRLNTLRNDMMNSEEQN